MQLSNKFMLLLVLIAAPNLAAMQFMRTLWETMEIMTIYCHAPASAIEQYEDEQARHILDQQTLIRNEYNDRVLERRISNITTSAIKVGVIVVGSNYLMSNPNFIMFVGLVGMGFRDKIEDSIRSFQHSIFPPEELVLLDEIGLKILLDNRINSKHRDLLDNDIKNIRTRFANQRMHNNNDKDLRRMIKRLELILSLPTSTKPINEYSQKDPYGSQAIEASMKCTYDPHLVNSIKKLVYQIFEDSKNNTRDIAKTAVYFMGVPGTGKTTTASLIAKVLDLPFFAINLSKIEPAQLSSSASNPNDDLILPGEIAACFIDKKDAALNTIFFLDEVHDALSSKNPQSPRFQSMLKRLLDPDVKYFRDDTLGIDIDVSKAIFILAGNSELDDHKGALSDRLLTYQFKPASKDVRALIAYCALAKANRRFGLKISKKDSILQKIIAKDQELYADHGVRPLQKVVTSYVSFRSACIKGVLNQDCQFDIDEEFSQSGARLSIQDY